MGVVEILASVDREIEMLQQVRALLVGIEAPKKSVGRPKKAVATVATVTASPAAKKRKLSPEGRKRIAEAAKRRWALQRKAAASQK